MTYDPPVDHRKKRVKKAHLEYGWSSVYKLWILKEVYDLRAMHHTCHSDVHTINY